MDALPSLPSLTPDDRLWRLDWFGDCGYPSHIPRYGQPGVRIALSPLRCDPSDHEALLSPACTDHQHQREVWPPAAALPLLAIGDIWREGRLAVSPDYQVESFKGLRIAPDRSAFVKAGLAIDESFLLPLAHHPWHRNHTQSYCVSVALADERRLLVPCVELIRFYFGSSGKLVQRLFAAPLRQEMLWASKRFNSENRHLHLVLASGLSGVSATDIGRTAESRHAWRAAAGIHASCQKAAAQRQPAYPYTGFPFEGTTTLTASGIWLPFGDRESATFLVYRIRSCSHPFPFDSLSYEASDRKARHDGKGGDESGAKTFTRGRNHERTGSNTTDSDPGSNKASRAAFFRRPLRFPDLVRKQVWREKMEVAPKPDIFLRQPDGHLELVAFGEGEGYSAVSGVDPIQDAEKRAFSEEEPALPHFVRAGLKEIAGKPENANAQINLVCPPGKTHPIFSVPMVVDEEGEIANEAPPQTDELYGAALTVWGERRIGGPRLGKEADESVSAIGPRKAGV